MEKAAEQHKIRNEHARILIIDDDPALLQALPGMLKMRMSHVEADTIDSAWAGLERIQEKEYDAVISDIKMQGMDGFEFLAEAQKIQPELPVLLMTGYGEHGMALRALRGGAYDYVLKPIERDDFIGSIQRAIDTGKLRKQVKAQQQALQVYASSLQQQIDERTLELMRTNSQLVAANESREQMLRMVVHELAKPLTSVKGMAQLLQRQVQRETPYEKLGEGFNLLTSPLLRIERLIVDLHDAIHIQEQQFIVEPGPHNMIELCQHVLAEFTIHTTPLPQVDSTAQAIMAEVDVERISQVLINLITNARKYSAKSAPIIVRLQQQGETIALSVQDFGVGIPAEALGRIYEQFYRVPEVDRMSDSVTGLGLGLYITDAIVKLHHGHINVESVMGQGSTFTVTLPALEGYRDYVSPLLEWRLEGEIEMAGKV